MLYKIIFLTQTLLFASYAQATCPDLTGNYSFTSPDTGFTDVFSITQNETDGLTTYLIQFNQDLTTGIADGQPRTNHVKDANWENISVDSFVCQNHTLVQAYTEKVIYLGDGEVYVDYEGSVIFSLSKSKSSDLLLEMKSKNLLTGEIKAETLLYTRK